MVKLSSTISYSITINYLFSTLIIYHSVSSQISHSIAYGFFVNITPLSTAISIAFMINLSLSHLKN
jgi:uncharacterized protein (DUF2062 family)